MNCYPKPIGCGREIPPEEFDSWDHLSQKEFGLSGLCLDPCQNLYFSEDEDEADYEVPCKCQGMYHLNDCPNWVMPF